jgi:hypothetical protein
LIELLVVIAIIAILASMLLPTLGKGKTKAQGIACVNNLKQLQQAWMLYADDHQERFVPVGTILTTASDPADPRVLPGHEWAQWVHGNVSVVSTGERTNTDLIKVGLLWPWIKSVGVYKCPGDTFMREGQIAVRSMSINMYLNPVGVEGTWHPWDPLGVSFSLDDLARRSMKKISDMRNPEPSSIWVVTDESPVSIDDGMFSVMPKPWLSWYSAPAINHNHANGFAFADGHVETRRWTDGALYSVASAYPDSGGGGGVVVESSGPDYGWLQDRTYQITNP